MNARRIPDLKSGASPLVGIAVIGLGPAGVAVFRAAQRVGLLEQLAKGGLCLVDEDPERHVGAGALGDYHVRSDTAGRVFIECCDLGAGTAGMPAALARCATADSVPLAAAAELLHAASRTWLAEVRDDERICVVPGRVVRLSRAAGVWELDIRRGEGHHLTVRASSVVVATGGQPYLPAWLRDLGAVHADQILRGRLPSSWPSAPRGPGDRSSSPSVTIVGSSHSAFAAALKVLERDPRHQWEPGAITIRHRSPVRVSYPDIVAARLDGITVGPDDVCPATGRVFRFGGLRGAAAQLWRDVRAGVEDRVRLAPMSRTLPTDEVVHGTLLIGATGYQGRVDRLLGAPLSGSAWCFAATTELLDGHGAVVPGIYGAGLGAGRRRDSRTGGEASFTGTINGVWFYQRVVAPIMVERLLSPSSGRRLVSPLGAATRSSMSASTQRPDAAPSP